EWPRLEALIAKGDGASHAPAGARTEPRPWRLVAIGIPAMAAVAVALVGLPRWLGRSESTITLRGGSEKLQSGPKLLVYAKRKGASGVRLVAELPGSGEARVSLNDYVQFRGSSTFAPAYALILSVDPAGQVH